MGLLRWGATIFSFASFLEEINNTLGTYQQSQPVNISARADGDIQIEWSNPPLEVFVHIGPLNTTGFLFIDRQGDSLIYEEVTNASWDETAQRVAIVLLSA